MDWRWAESGKRIKLLSQNSNKRRKLTNDLPTHTNQIQILKTRHENLLQRQIALYKKQVQEASYTNCSESNNL